MFSPRMPKPVWSTTTVPVACASERIRMCSALAAATSLMRRKLGSDTSPAMVITRVFEAFVQAAAETRSSGSAKLFTSELATHSALTPAASSRPTSVTSAITSASRPRSLSSGKYFQTFCSFETSSKSLTELERGRSFLVCIGMPAPWLCSFMPCCAINQPRLPFAFQSAC